MFKSISLFSGAGGLDLGLEQEGFATCTFVEIDKDAQSTLRTNQGLRLIPDAPVLDDITSISADEVLAAAGLAKGEAVLLAGGAPCQSSGRYSGHHGDAELNWLRNPSATRLATSPVPSQMGHISASISSIPR